MTTDLYDVLIIGGGPSGLTAAIYTARADLKTAVLAGSPPGGQLLNTTEVENFPGFPNGILGPELVSNFRAQAEKFGAMFVDTNVTKIEGSYTEMFNVIDENGNEYKSKTIIIATGANANWLGLENETRLKGKGVSACAVCDGFFFKDKVVAVVGAGDSAMEESTYLSKYASKIYVIARKPKDELKASKIMQQRALTNPKIEFIYSTEVVDVLGDNVVSGITLKNLITGEKSTLDVQGLFLAIGHHPNTDFLKDFIEVDDHGYVKISNNTLTSKEGVFVGGDVSDYRYRQAVTAAGLGCMAALDAEKFLAEHGK